PQGASTSMSLGNGLAESTAFNNRLQPTSIGLGTLANFGYGYGTTNNSGNLLSQSISIPGWGVTQSYGYDPLNRLTSASESASWSQSYGYDQYGNRTSVTSPTYLPTYAPAPAVNATNNRFSDASFSYDAVGNLTRGPIIPGGALQNYGYDAENRLISFNTGAATYSYDGDGKRVKNTVGSSTTIFVYDVGGRLIAEYSNTASTTTGGTSYLTADHLDSTRVVTDASGNLKGRHDYLPFGEEIPSGIGGRTTPMGYGSNEGVRQKFTGKERDAESGLDYFGARYNASSMGRFMTPDWSAKPQTVPYADLGNPQSLNLYSYVVNNPLNRTDPLGHDWFYVDKKWQWQKGHVYHDADGNATKDKGYSGLLVATATGKNKQGATTYSLTLYNQDKVAATGTGFSGGAPPGYTSLRPVRDGNYMLRLGVRDSRGPNTVEENPNSPYYGTPPGFSGIQEIHNIPASGGGYWPEVGAWGQVRAFLNPLEGQGGHQYVHGQENGYGYTHGCLSYGNDRAFGEALWNAPAVDTPAAVNVPVDKP
ncbi:MAG: RHS repeat domain-containing protein, partial [Terriglobia bacterium]